MQIPALVQVCCEAPSDFYTSWRNGSCAPALHHTKTGRRFCGRNWAYAENDTPNLREPTARTEQSASVHCPARTGRPLITAFIPSMNLRNCGLRPIRCEMHLRTHGASDLRRRHSRNNPSIKAAPSRTGMHPAPRATTRLLRSWSNAHDSVGSLGASDCSLL